MVKRSVMTLGLGLGLAIAPALAQSVGNALDSEGMPQNITVFGAPADHNVRKASAIVNGSVITDLDVAQQILDDYLDCYRDYLPQFRH